MNINIIGTIINTILLIILIFYQRNKNRVLIDRINNQGKIIDETKGLITQQSNVIASQKTVVDTAIKYSESFSPEKLEGIIRREVELKYREELKDAENEINQKIEYTKTETERNAQLRIKSISDSFIQPYLKALTVVLFSADSKQREKITSSIENAEARDLLLGIFNDIRNEMLKRGIIKNVDTIVDISDD